MTPFLATTTERGSALLLRVREAKDKESFAAVFRHMNEHYAAEFAGGPAYTPADRYVFLCAVAEKTPNHPRARAASYDGAGTTAMIAGAYEEAVFAFEMAEAARKCPERKKRIEAIRELLLARAGGDRVRKVPEPERRPVRTKRAGRVRSRT